ncbi:unnamed protein product, partial [marine sediment metagenome]
MINWQQNLLSIAEECFIKIAKNKYIPKNESLEYVAIGAARE